MTVYIAVLAVVIGLMPVLFDKWRAAQRKNMIGQPAQREQWRR